MIRRHIAGWPVAGLLFCALVPVAFTGCQTTIGGQTLPSAYYLEDDVQYFPAGPEDPLPRLRRALDEYRVERQVVRGGIP